MITPFHVASSRGHRHALSFMVLAVQALLSPVALADAHAPAPGLTTVSVALPNASLLLQLNQVALERTGPKSAIVEYRGMAEAGSYRVTSRGKTVAGGALKPLPAFDAWGPGRRYFEADFSALQTPGRYRVEVQIGTQTVVSGPVDVLDRALFKVTASKLWTTFAGAAT